MVDLRVTGSGQAAPRLSAGLLTADLTRLAEEISILDGSCCWAHIDVMDGVFCPQLTVGAPVVAAAASSVSGRAIYTAQIRRSIYAACPNSSVPRRAAAGWPPRLAEEEPCPPATQARSSPRRRP